MSTQKYKDRGRKETNTLVRFVAVTNVLKDIIYLITFMVVLQIRKILLLSVTIVTIKYIKV